jgi:hypothetical protein
MQMRDISQSRTSFRRCLHATSENYSCNIAGKGIKVEGSPFQQLFRRIPSLYIVEYVGKEPAAQPNWARTPVDCDCPHCHSLNEFLLHPTEISRRFEGISEVLEHISNAATFWTRYDCEGDEKEFSLTVMTTTKDYERDHKGWAKGYGSARKHLAELQSETLRNLLDDMYGSIMSLCATELRPYLDNPHDWKPPAALWVDEDDAASNFSLDSANSALENQSSSSYVLYGNTGTICAQYDFSGTLNTQPNIVLNDSEPVDGAKEKLISLAEKKAF